MKSTIPRNLPQPCPYIALMTRRTLLFAATTPLLARRIAIPPDFGKQLTSWLAVAPVPGAQVGLLENGKPQPSLPFGVSNAESKASVTRDTVFAAASLTKQLVAWLALRMADQGRLDLERPLADYGLTDLSDPQSRRIHARHVLSHSSGLPNWRFDAGEVLKPSFTPGERYQYSGEGFVLLQRVIEKIENRGFGAVMQAQVFGPLEMKSSSVTWRSSFASSMAHPHSRRGAVNRSTASRNGTLLELAAKWKRPIDEWRYEDALRAVAESGGDKQAPLPVMVTPNAAASLWTTADDYTRFLAAAVARRDWFTPRVSVSGPLDWGLGWGIENRRFAWQWGDNPGFKNFVLLDLETRRGIVVFTNGDAGMRVCERVIRAATGEDHPLFLWV